jgi:hypothetical protein
MSKLWRVALLLLGSAIISAVALEIAVTIIFGQQVRFARHVVGAPFGVRVNEPGAQYRHESADISVEFRINEKGLRSDHDFPYDKQPGTARIVTLGDSYTVGFEVEVEQTFSEVMERALTQRGYKVEVLNAGVSGYSTAEAYRYLTRELLRYDPDVVLLSFFGNDLVDNVRTNMFTLNGDELLETNYGYVPGGRVGDFLNTNSLLNFLNVHSNAFALTKETVTGVIKSHLVAANMQQLEKAEVAQDLAGDESDTPEDDGEYAIRITAAILERFYAATSERGIPLIIQSIPTRLYEPLRLVELFPRDAFPVEREGLVLVTAKDILDPWLSRELLYHTQSQNHWTPRSHELSGEELAALIDEEGWLPRPAEAQREP